VKGPHGRSEPIVAKAGSIFRGGEDMCTWHHDRREFLAGMGLSAATLLWGGTLGAADAQAEAGPHVAINQWSVGAMRGRDNKRSGVSLDEELAGLAACGIDGLEPGLQTPEQAEALATQLARHGLEMRSVYTGSELLDPAATEKEIERILALAKRAKAVGTKIIVTNPSPLPDRRGKTDAQLEAQAAGLNRLGRELAALAVTLAYHNHDIELDHAAREFHHMMLATEPGCLSLCLDAHWVYRGANHSQVALFDVVKLYGQRVVELHLRQSTNNVWSETFGDGDIDYRALWKALVGSGVEPLLVLEQGPEQGTPQTIEIAEAHRRSCRYAKEVFARRS
jgi:inosose dehydratase